MDHERGKRSLLPPLGLPTKANRGDDEIVAKSTGRPDLTKSCMSCIKSFHRIGKSIRQSQDDGK